MIDQLNVGAHIQNIFKKLSKTLSLEGDEFAHKNAMGLMC